MAFPAVQTTAESATTTAGTSHTVTLPSGITSGDLLIVIFSHAVSCTLNALTGWTELVDTAAANAEKVLYRKADGTEGASISLTSSASTKMSAIAYRISGAEDPATQAPQLSTVATGTSTAPNATTCTPTGGAKDYLWLTFFTQAGEEADDDTWTTGTPTNFTNLLQKTSGTTAAASTNVQNASAQQQLNASSLDAAAFTTAQSLAWRAWTLAIHPAADRTPVLIAAQPTDIGQDHSLFDWAPFDEEAVQGARTAMDVSWWSGYRNVATYSDLVLRDGAVGYWRLGEPSGTNAADSSGNGLAGTYVNTPALAQAGLVANNGSDTSVDFLGSSSEYVDLGAPLQLRLSDSWSIEAWVKFPSSVVTQGAIVSQLYNGTSLNFTLGFWDGGSDSLAPNVGYYESGNGWHVAGPTGTAITPGVPHHIVGTWDKATRALRIYVDGVLKQETTTSPGDPVTSTSNVRIASRWDGAGVPFHTGTIDEVAIYGSELSAEKVLEHYTQGAYLEPVVHGHHNNGHHHNHVLFDWSPFNYEANDPVSTVDSFAAASNPPAAPASDAELQAAGQQTDPFSGASFDWAPFDYEAVDGAFASTGVEGVLAPNFTGIEQFEGASPGTTITTSNTIFTSLGGTPNTFDNDMLVGTASGRMGGSAGGNSLLVFAIAGRPQSRWFVTSYFAYTPGSNVSNMLLLTHAVGSTSIVHPKIFIKTDGTLLIVTQNINRLTGSVVIPRDRWFRLEVCFEQIETRDFGNERITIALFLDPTSSTPDENLTVVGATNWGVATGGLHVSDEASLSLGMAVWVDEYQISTEAMPVSSLTAPEGGQRPSLVAAAHTFDQAQFNASFDWAPFDYEAAAGPASMGGLGVEGVLAPNFTTSTETFDGIAPEVAVTGTNTIFNNVSLTGSGLSLADNDLVVGNASWRVSVADSGGLARVISLDNDRVQNRWFLRFNWAYSGYPIVGQTKAFIQNFFSTVRITSTGALTIVDGVTVLATSSTLVPPDDWVRLEVLLERQSSGSVFISVAIYLSPTSVSPDETISGIATTNAPYSDEKVQIGWPGNGAVGAIYPAAFWFDDMAFSTEAMPALTGTAPAPGERPSKIAAAHTFDQQQMLTGFDWAPFDYEALDPASAHDIAWYFAPVAGGDAIISGELATATADALTPTLKVDAVVTAPMATATADANAPTIQTTQLDAIYGYVPEDAVSLYDWAPFDEEAVQGARVSMDVSSAFAIPATISAPMATATADALVPTLKLDAVVTAPMATATADANAPVIQTTQLDGIYGYSPDFNALFDWAPHWYEALDPAATVATESEFAIGVTIQARTAGASAAVRPVNPAPFSAWTATAGAPAYDAVSDEWLMSLGDQVSSPLVDVRDYENWSILADFWSSTVSSTHTPLAGMLWGTVYYKGDGSTPATNSQGWTGNGNSQSLPIADWANRGWSYVAGFEVVYVRFVITADSTFFSAGTNTVRIRNAVVRVPQQSTGDLTPDVQLTGKESQVPFVPDYTASLHDWAPYWYQELDPATTVATESEFAIATTVTAPMATATADALVPTLKVDAVSTSPMATATADALAPTVETSQLEAIYSFAPDATGALFEWREHWYEALDPASSLDVSAALRVDATISAPMATATADALTPTLKLDAVITGVMAAATADANTPSVETTQLDAIMSFAPDATAALFDWAPYWYQELDPASTVATESEFAIALTVTAPMATAAADANTPTLKVDAVVTSPLGIATADALTPSVETSQLEAIFAFVPDYTLTLFDWAPHWYEALDPATTVATESEFALALTVNAPMATATADALVPTLKVDSVQAAPMATATADALTPALKVDAITTGVMATAAADALVPSIVTTQVEPFIASYPTGSEFISGQFDWALHWYEALDPASSVDTSPQFAIATTVTAPMATATADALTPTLKLDAVITGVMATATADANTPAIEIDEANAVPTATATADALAPTISVNETVDAPMATATADALTPTLKVDAVVIGVMATATADALVPTLKVDSVVTSVMATATADANTPTVITTQIEPFIAAYPASSEDVAGRFDWAPHWYEALDPASSVDTAPAFAIALTVTSPLATATADALVPSLKLDAVVAAVMATATADALAPSVSNQQILTSPMATATADALTPVIEVDEANAAPYAEATADALVPSISTQQILTAPMATATAMALVPSLELGGATYVYAEMAEATADALTPTLKLDAVTTSVLATATAEALAPVIEVDESNTAPMATATADALAPTISVNEANVAPMAAATADALAPTVQVDESNAAPMATATADALVPTVTTQQVIAGVLVTATADALAPSIQTSTTITAVTATTTASADTPTIELSVHPLTAVATADALAPSISTQQILTSPMATATAEALVPSPSNAADIASPTAVATADALVPTIVAATSLTVNAPTATATATALPPSLTGDIVLAAPMATATASALNAHMVLHQRHTHLRGTEKPQVDLRGTEKPNVELRGTHMPTVDLRGTYMPAVDLRGTYLPSVDLRGTWGEPFATASCGFSSGFSTGFGCENDPMEFDSSFDTSFD